jgi:hypothetical protein
VSFRGALEDELGVELPSTLLYDHRTLDEIAVALDTAGSGDYGPLAVPDDGFAGDLAVVAAPDYPSARVRILRGVRDRPLFLAAPGVANAQAAYFGLLPALAFSRQAVLVVDKARVSGLRPETGPTGRQVNSNLFCTTTIYHLTPSSLPGRRPWTLRTRRLDRP